MQEVRPGVFYWSTFHERIGHTVSSYYLVHGGEAVLIDPRMPDEGPDWFRARIVPSDIILTNRHHYRHSDAFVEAFGCTVRCHRTGVPDLTAGQEVVPYDFGERLACGAETIEVASLCPDETAIYFPWARALSVADGLVRVPYDGPLSFVPDMLMGDDPATVKAGLLTAFRRLLQRDFDTILLAHGAPWVDGAKDALRCFVESTEKGPGTGPQARSHPAR